MTPGSSVSRIRPLAPCRIRPRQRHQLQIPHEINGTNLLQIRNPPICYDMHPPDRNDVASIPIPYRQIMVCRNGMDFIFHWEMSKCRRWSPSHVYNYTCYDSNAGTKWNTTYEIHKTDVGPQSVLSADVELKLAPLCVGSANPSWIIKVVIPPAPLLMAWRHSTWPQCTHRWPGSMTYSTKET